MSGLFQRYRRLPPLWRTAIICFSVTVTLLLFIVPIFIIYQNEATRSSSTSYLYKVDEAYFSGAAPSKEDQINVLVRVHSVDFATSNIKFVVRVVPTGKFGKVHEDEQLATLDLSKSDSNLTVNADDFDNFDPSSEQLVVSFGGALTRHFDDDQIISSFELNIPFDFGDQANYPFDTYEGHMPLRVFLKSKPYQRLPTGFLIDTTLPGVTVIPTVYISQQYPSRVELVVKRSMTTRVFAVYVQIMMWLLSLGALWIALDHVSRYRDITPPVLGFYMSMLFAMPALRNTAPGIPQIGTAGDKIGFFWNMLIIAVSALMMLVLYVVRYPSNTVKMMDTSPSTARRNSLSQKYPTSPQDDGPKNRYDTSSLGSKMYRNAIARSSAVSIDLNSGSTAAPRHHPEFAPHPHEVRLNIPISRPHAQSATLIRPTSLKSL